MDTIELYRNYNAETKAVAKKNLYEHYEIFPKQVSGFLKTLEEERGEGLSYYGNTWASDCCLKGTLCKLAIGKEIKHVDLTLFRQNAFRSTGKSEEEHCLLIHSEDTPKTNPFVKDSQEWTIEWFAGRYLLK